MSTTRLYDGGYFTKTVPFRYLPIAHFVGLTCVFDPCWMRGCGGANVAVKIIIKTKKQSVVWTLKPPGALGISKEDTTVNLRPIVPQHITLN
jgi:hypothetical protein